ncbi:MAG: hypothetical protein Q4B68_06155 [Bacteroidales bacterium]|nr:hypothetical protein [Bacteroidales bacterium]
MLRLRYLLITVLGVCCISVKAQDAAVKYNQFQKQAKQEYAEFRKRCNAEYAEFLKEAWAWYKAGPVLPKPKDETVPPVVMPEEDIHKPIESNPVPIDTVVTPIIDEPAPQPKPVAPIYENPNPAEEYLQFTFFGTTGRVRLPAGGNKAVGLLKNQPSGHQLAKAWEMLSNGDYDNLIRDCLELRIRHQLCDWAYLLMIREIGEQYCGGNSNAATMLTAWIFCQSGYQMRLADANGKLYLLFGTQHQIYEMPYFYAGGAKFYPLLRKGEDLPSSAQICEASFPGEQPLSLYVSSAQSLAEKLSAERIIKSQQASATSQVNENLLEFYSTYPTSMIGENVCSRWAMYANTPMADNVKQKLYPQLRNAISGKTDLEAANVLLNWVQAGFTYGYDDKIWGGDRAFFAEETLYYPYCDCEDRSILFTRLVRDLLGLKCILVYYPGHLAAAVQFKEPVKGDYINLDGHQFTVTDPTYIGAPVGRTMPNMDNKKATVILLQ